MTGIAERRSVSGLEKGQQLQLQLWGSLQAVPLETLTVVFERAVKVNSLLRLDFIDTKTNQPWSIFKRRGRWTWGLLAELVVIRDAVAEYI